MCMIRMVYFNIDWTGYDRSCTSYKIKRSGTDSSSNFKVVHKSLHTELSMLYWRYISKHGRISTPNSGQGFSPNGYDPQPGERTLDGYVKNQASPEISLHTDSAGFNNNNGNVGGDFKRFGAEAHGGVSPHVHQPKRNVAPNGNIYGTLGTKTANGGVTSPSTKDVKQLYEYLTNGKYH